MTENYSFSQLWLIT